MAPVSINVTQLRCATVDQVWRKAWMAGESPDVREFPSAPTAPVYGSKFHMLARKLTQQLRNDGSAESDDHNALLQRVYALGADKLLGELLEKGKVDSAAALTTALHALCDRMLQLRARTPFAKTFLAEEYELVDVPLETVAGKLFVSGAIDCIRMRGDGSMEVVDYKLTTGEALDKEVAQIALYRRLLMAQDQTLNPSGVLEYFLPGLTVTELSPSELDHFYATSTAPLLGEMVAARKALRGAHQSPPPKVIETPALRSKSRSSAASEARLRLGRSRGYQDDPVELSIGDLKRHAAVIGGSGSGKTTLAMNLVEQVLELGVPVMLVDRKGDLARYADPHAWEVRDQSERQARRAALRAKLDIDLYTPGHSGGRPLALPIVPDVEGLEHRDRQQLMRAGAQGLAEMLRLGRGAADEAKRGILKQALEALCDARGAATVTGVIELLESEDAAFLETLGILAKQADKLLMQLKSFELMNQELLAETGEALDVERMFGLGDYSIDGRTRLAIVSTRFFDGEAAALFWVSQLLGELNQFASRNPSSSLQALVMFDEADVYLPATRSPITKGPMESLLKRARSAGLGVMLCTQSPGDLDYKCRENVLTWLIGRVKEARALEKLNPLASSVSVDAARAFPRQSIGEFYALSESSARAFHSPMSLLETSQLPEREILELARKR